MTDSECPLTPQSVRRKPKSYNYSNGDSFQPYSTAEVNDTIPYQLGFAMTIHKAQGTTIDKVVIDLYCQPSGSRWLKFDGVFVALSRVRSRADLRLLRHEGSSFEEAYCYITKLLPSLNVTSFYRGFHGVSAEGQTWNPSLALEGSSNA